MKLHIFGASGAGVTTTGLALAEILNIPYFDSDFYFWEQTHNPFTVRRDPAVRNQRIEEDTASYNAWILGGSVFDWHSAVSSEFTLAVFLWVPPAIRIERLKACELQRYGTIIYTDSRRHKQFNDFIEWASGYDTGRASGRTLHAHQQWMNTLTCPVLELRADLTLETRLQNILSHIEK